MTTLVEDKSGWESKFLDGAKPVTTLTSAASKLTNQFSAFKKAQIDKENKAREAEQRRIDAEKRNLDAEREREQKRKDQKAKQDAEYAEKERERLARRIERQKNRAEADRKARKDIRDKREQERAEEQKAKEEHLRQRMADGHIMQINYKFKYRELLLTFASSKVVQLYKDGKIDNDVLTKLFKYGKSIETLFQKYPGALVTSIRQHKFEQHPGMAALTSKSKGTSGKDDGPYRLIHPLFGPKNVGSYENDFRKSLIADYAENQLFKSVTDSAHAVGNPHGFGFSPEECVLNFNQILKATGVGTIDYIVIGWYNRTYHAVKNKGATILGQDDPNRDHKLDLDTENDWGKTEYTQKLEQEFPMHFFKEFTQVFELIRLENMRLYSVIEDLIRQAGILIDQDDIDKANTHEDPDINSGDSFEDTFL